MSNWNQLYDLEPLLHTPPTGPISKQHSYITCKPYKRYDSDISSVCSSEGVEDFDSPIWWDILDHEEEAIARYKKFLQEQLVKGRSLEKQTEPKAAMIRVEVSNKAVPHTPSVSLPERSKEKSDHTHIVEKMRDSRDLAGPVEFCFWSLNSQPCQCGKC
ncbi:hypothetical protein M436DRAFT_76148 [Aureobasidium namibiae CBS 147.97]|uniref:Uncharacterized protein n=1 Tax=Aureobasidium namibiae CBS 147.97 TaxID=1043004 RepID=A0A074W7W6_9PEZI